MSDTDSVNPEQRTSSRLAQMGLKATKVYFILLFAFLPSAYWMGWLDLKPITLNEIGDFLAGVFGPLSIFWLVLGFFQQGSELRLQVTELANSVAQQKEMVDVSREALTHEREMVVTLDAARKEQVRPKLRNTIESVYSMGAAELTTVELHLVNIGEQLSQITLEVHPPYAAGNIPNPAILTTGEAIDFNVKYRVGEKPAEIELRVSCSDLDGYKHSLIFSAETRAHSIFSLRPDTTQPPAPLA